MPSCVLSETAVVRHLARLGLRRPPSTCTSLSIWMICAFRSVTVPGLPGANEDCVGTFRDPIDVASVDQHGFHPAWAATDGFRLGAVGLERATKRILLGVVDPIDVRVVDRVAQAHEEIHIGNHRHALPSTLGHRHDASRNIIGAGVVDASIIHRVQCCRIGNGCR